MTERAIAGLTASTHPAATSAALIFFEPLLGAINRDRIERREIIIAASLQRVNLQQDIHRTGAHLAGARVVSVKDMPTVFTRQHAKGSPEGLL